MVVHFLEAIGFITGVWSVWLNAREKISGWPIGLISVASYAYVFYSNELYADMLLQIIYCPLTLWGWYYWKRQSKKDVLKVKKITSPLLCYLLLNCIIFTILLGRIIHNYTQSDFGYLDVAASTLSLTAEWLLGKKIIENWIFWIIADAGFAGLYITKGLYLTSLLYFIFILLSFHAYGKWKIETKSSN